MNKSTLQSWVKGVTDPIGEPKQAEDARSVTERYASAIAENKRLKEELRRSELHNKLLNSMIEKAEERLGVDIRKENLVPRVDERWAKRTEGPRVLCSLLSRNRQAYYWRLAAGEKEVFGAELLVQEVLSIRRDMKRVGGRKLYLMTEVFRDEHRIAGGRDAFFEVLREEGLLVSTRRSRKPRTTYSCWWHKKYPNLIKERVTERPNRVWVSDITFA